MKLLCIDGNSVLNRAFYAIKLLTTKDGHYTNAVFGFMNMFLKLTDEQKPDAVAAAFDLRGKTFRHERYDKYKATRKPMPPELAEQLPVVQQLLRDLGYTVVTCQGYEADDILGTFAKSCERRGDECLIATGDRDSLQLVAPTTKILLTTTHFGRGEMRMMDTAEVEKDYGVTPAQLIDVKALMGDSSDNIPGVPGVGEKTALALIARFKTLDAVYENIDSADIKDGVRRRLNEGRDSAYMSRELAEICTAAPIDTDPARYVRAAGDPDAAARLLGELEMHSLRRRLQLPETQAVSANEEDENEDTPPQQLTAEAAAKLERIYLISGENGFAAGDGKRVYTVPRGLLEQLLSDEKTAKYCYDAKKFYKYALERGTPARGIVFDLKLAAYLLSPASADYLPQRLAAEYRVKPTLRCDAQPDAALLAPLCDKLAALLEEQGMDELLRDIELPLSRVLARMEDKGFLVDVKGIADFGEELQKVIEQQTAAIYSAAGREFNLNSPKQLGEVLFVTLALPTVKKTKSGFSTDAETLEKLSGAHPIIEHILTYRSYQKLYSTYVQGLTKAADSDRRIHTDFIQTETRTGRISSREPNLQNIPVRTELGSRLRRYFIAAAGSVLLDADYSQIELRVLASVSSDQKMTAAFLSGRDIHTETASQVFSVPREQVSAELRRRAKAVNFGIVYGIGAYSLAKDTGVSVHEADEYIKNYLATYDGVRRYLEDTVATAARDGFVTTAYGRRRAIPELASSNRQVQSLGKRLAMNTPIQGTAADIIKIAMIRVDERLQKEELNARLILQVHDELIIEAPQEEAERAAALLKEEMQKAAALTPPLIVDVGKGTNWYDAK